MSKELNRPSASLSSYKAVLDKLLDAGSSGVTLEPWKHLPHLETIPSFVCGESDSICPVALANWFRLLRARLYRAAAGPQQ
ncbi:hypothetical protein DM02DRAFT_662527 [Periconia macrospinosa]|uniref:Uncharacterized protein n=1 Tax=Periconia macrospinosa TaxID=97972 RepID=A0A2V1D4A3_9PLEO|nr:hypothetical protein DM02DRAFT_662527 [Periconia macrospinosa]